MDLNVGDLDTEFWIQRPAGEDGSYENVDSVPTFAAIRGAVGNELLRFATPIATGASIVTIRYRQDIRASWRLVEAAASPDRTLQITSFQDPTGGKVMLQLYCVEVL